MKYLDRLRESFHTSFECLNPTLSTLRVLGFTQLQQLLGQGEFPRLIVGASLACRALQQGKRLSLLRRLIKETFRQLVLLCPEKCFHWKDVLIIALRAKFCWNSALEEINIINIITIIDRYWMREFMNEQSIDSTNVRRPLFLSN